MLTCCIMVFGLLAYTFFSNSPRDIQNYTIENMDKEIKLSWISPRISSIDHIELSVSYTTGELLSQPIVLPRSCQEYHFKDGCHGSAYIFSLTAIYKDGTSGQQFSSKGLFLDYSQLPDLPVISITTANGTSPTYEVVTDESTIPPGISITNNDFIAGSMSLIQDGQASSATRMKIRVRGNTSSALNIKKTYKIVLDKPLDLLGLGSEYADKDWILLGAGGSQLHTYIGQYLAGLCGVEWTPRMKFVNLMLNNEWMGHYVLIESVKKSAVRCNISSDGYLFEYDAYWWNTGEKYFKTECLQIDPAYKMGFTIKYPQIKNRTDQKVLLLKEYMEAFETCLYTGDEHFWEYIDMDSFVTWIMVWDLLGGTDAMGANMYYTIYDLDPSDPTSSKLKMGPLWDFDGSFPENPNSYSMQHTYSSPSGLYFNELFTYEPFITAYRAKWDEVRNDIFTELEYELRDLCRDQGQALNESRILDGIKNNYHPLTIEDEIAARLAWFEAKADWMDNMLHTAEE